MTLDIARVERIGPRQARGLNHRARLVVSPDDPAATSPFLLMAEDQFAPPAGFPEHPHRGMETVTFVLSGQLEHGDHTGSDVVTEAGGVQFMTAGSGVMHSEMPGARGVLSLQLWLNLPARLKWAPAQFRTIRRQDAPVYRQPGVEARVYAGRVGDAEIAHASTWPLTLIDLTLSAGTQFDLPVPAAQRLFAYMLDGDGLIGGNRSEVQSDTVAWARIGDDMKGDDQLPICARNALRVLVFASPVIEETVVFGGPFVMNTEQEIDEAFADLRAGLLTRPRPPRGTPGRR